MHEEITERVTGKLIEDRIKWFVDTHGELPVAEVMVVINRTIRSIVTDAVPLLCQELAYRIRAELVCCDIYRHHAMTSKAGTHHSICFWGEGAARLVEDHDDEDIDHANLLKEDRDESEVQLAEASLSDGTDPHRGTGCPCDPDVRRGSGVRSGRKG